MSVELDLVAVTPDGDRKEIVVRVDEPYEDDGLWRCKACIDGLQG